MKTIKISTISLLAVILALSLSTRSFAQVEPSAREAKQYMPGLWQQVFPDGKYSTRLKNIKTDGTWENIWFMPQNGQAISYMQGTYKISPDGIYTETMEKSTMPEYNGKSTDMTIEAFDNDHIKLSFLWGDKTVTETWNRVTMPLLTQPQGDKPDKGDRH
jgi:hypothetical protein